MAVTGGHQGHVPMAAATLGEGCPAGGRFASTRGAHALHETAGAAAAGGRAGAAPSVTFAVDALRTPSPAAPCPTGPLPGQVVGTAAAAPAAPATVVALHEPLLVPMPTACGRAYACAPAGASGTAIARLDVDDPDIDPRVETRGGSTRRCIVVAFAGGLRCVVRRGALQLRPRRAGGGGGPQSARAAVVAAGVKEEGGEGGIQNKEAKDEREGTNGAPLAYATLPPGTPLLATRDIVVGGTVAVRHGTRGRFLGASRKHPGKLDVAFGKRRQVVRGGSVAVDAVSHVARTSTTASSFICPDAYSSSSGSSSSSSSKGTRTREHAHTHVDHSGPCHAGPVTAGRPSLPVGTEGGRGAAGAAARVRGGHVDGSDDDMGGGCTRGGTETTGPRRRPRGERGVMVDVGFFSGAGRARDIHSAPPRKGQPMCAWDVAPGCEAQHPLSGGGVVHARPAARAAVPPPFAAAPHGGGVGGIQLMAVRTQRGDGRPRSGSSSSPVRGAHGQPTVVPRTPKVAVRQPSHTPPFVAGAPAASGGPAPHDGAGGGAARSATVPTPLRHHVAALRVGDPDAYARFRAVSAAYLEGRVSAAQYRREAGHLLCYVP